MLTNQAPETMTYRDLNRAAAVIVFVVVVCSCLVAVYVWGDRNWHVRHSVCRIIPSTENSSIQLLLHAIKRLRCARTRSKVQMAANIADERPAQPSPLYK